MQLGNVVVQFEEKLSSAGRDSVPVTERGALDAFRIAAITRCTRRAHASYTVSRKPAR